MRKEYEPKYKNGCEANIRMHHFQDARSDFCSTLSSKIFGYFSRRQFAINFYNMDFLYFIIVGALAGWLAGLIWRGTGFGLLGNIIMGIIGAMIGGWAAGQLGLFGGGLIYQILVAAGGALIILLLFRLIRG